MYAEKEAPVAEDMAVWRGLILDEVRSIADEEQQRKTWFGEGPWVDSPTEQFCAFFDNASVPEFLAHSDNRLNEQQKLHLTQLSALMRYVSDSIHGFIRPVDLIDDPRWEEIRKQATITLEILSKQD